MNDNGAKSIGCSIFSLFAIAVYLAICGVMSDARKKELKETYTAWSATHPETKLSFEQFVALQREKLLPK